MVRRRKLPDQIRSALHVAEHYRVKPSARGYCVWRFRDWDKEHPGWRVIIANIGSREEAWVRILDRLGLTAEDDPKPTVIPAFIAYNDHFELGGGWY